VKTGKLTASADRLGNDDGSAGFSRDGATLGIASSGELIHLWEFAKDKQPARIRLPDALLGKPRINGVGFSPREGRPMDAPLGEFACGPLRISGDLRTGASVLENGSIAIWDIAGRQVRKILPTGRQHGTFGGGIRTVSLSPDGHLLVVVSVLGYIDVWRLDGNVEAAAVKQPIDADEWPGPWGQALNGLQTRLILKPVKPGPGPPQGRSIAGDWVPYVPPEITSPGTRQIPVSEGVWWILCLQVRNETSKKLTFQWPNLAREGAIVVTHEDGRTVTFHPIAGDSQAIAAVWVGPSGDITTAGEMLLGRNYDMSRPGKYRFQFPQAEAASTLRDQVTNPTLPASNVLEFDSRQIP
jgi:WD40 repeat protein